jgi:hypothetical protein
MEWAEEWVPLAEVIPHAPWQVRAKLDEGAIKRYADMTRAGSTPPPILVGRVAGKLYLLDGWHRMEAGALQKMQSVDGVEVLAKVATMDKYRAQWEAAQANMRHGVQLRAKDLHEVFKAFIRSKQHVKPDGSLMSYREMAPFIGKPHTTVRTWVLRYFPKLAAEMGGPEHGNPNAEAPPLPSLDEEHRQEAMGALQTVVQRLELLTPEARWEVTREIERALAQANQLGTQEPGPSAF